MTQHGFKVFGAAVAFSLLLGQSASAATITLRSGNGPRPGLDSLISMLVGPPNSAFAGPITPAQFAAAGGGPSAFILGPINVLWKPHLASDPTAEWISTNASGAFAGSTALYAMNFTLPASILNATLDFDFLIDNELGDATNEGLFINGIPLLGTKLLGVVLSNFQMDQSFPTLNITSLVTPGLNTLYVNAVDRGGPSGLQFSATINVQSGAVPEPSTLLLLGTGLAALAANRRRRK